MNTMSYCTQCGGLIAQGAQFCTQCGAQAGAGTIAPAAASPGPKAQVSGSHALRNIVLAIVGALLVILALGIGGAVYVGIKAKQKVASYLHSEPHEQATGIHEPAKPDTAPRAPGADNATNILGGLLDKLSAASQQQSSPYEDLKFVAKSDYSSIQCPAPTPGDELREVSDAKIPFVPDLKLTTAWGRTPGDVETINTVAGIKPDHYLVISSGLTFKDDSDVKGTMESNGRRTCASDKKSSFGYITMHASYLPPIALDTTQVVLSSAAFNELKDTGKFTAKYLMYFQADDHSGVREHWREGTLTRVGNSDVDYPVIVNNDPVKLPTILARGTMLVTDKKMQAYTENINNRPTPVEIQVLDDPKNPLVLNYSFTNQAFRIQVVKIEYPSKEKTIEQALAKEKKVVVYGIYFDFNKDTIKPESEPVLKQIVQAMTDNPTWKLTVDGHTDNIGGDAYNLDLSKRRAAAVKRTLVDRYHIAPERLTTDGYGSMRPVDTNDTLEGRARNRRVELTRND